jgi:hypothetical protein
MPQDNVKTSDLYLYCSAFIIGLPILCGCLFSVMTWRSAQHNAHIWRGEFQYALDQQCPANEVNIVGGAGGVYLDANKLDYQWVRGDLTCSSNGRLVQCSCRANETDYTEVTGLGR